MTKATQDQLSTFVNREVLYNVNELMQHIFEKEPDLYFESFSNTLDYDSAIENLTDSELSEYTDKSREELTYSEKGDIAEDSGVDVTSQDPLEYWLVTNYLAEKLEDHGEMIAHDIHGLTSMGQNLQRSSYHDGRCNWQDI